MVIKSKKYMYSSLSGRAKQYKQNRPRSPRITGDERLSPGNRTGKQAWIIDLNQSQIVCMLYTVYIALPKQLREMNQNI